MSSRSELPSEARVREIEERHWSVEYGAVRVKDGWRKRLARLLDRLTDWIDPPRVRDGSC
jgi:hypothetical protein